MKAIKLIFVAMLAVVLAAGCDKKTQDEPFDYEEAIPYFESVPDFTEMVDAHDTSIEYKVTSNRSWTVEAVERYSWIKSYTKNGPKGESTLKITFEENTTNDSRAAYFNFKYDKLTYSILLEQLGVEESE